MKTLKDVKKGVYNNMKDRANLFLSDEERYIVDNLVSEVNCNWVSFEYTEDEACDIVCQSLDWIDSSDTESAMWEAWYIRWYEVALNQLILKYKDTIQYDSSYKAKQIVENLDYLLNN